MKLFRGYKSAPKFFVPEIAKEYEGLQSVKDHIWSKHPGKPIEAIDEMGDENFNRLHELQKIEGPQFFTDEEKAARDFAGEKEFIVAVDFENELIQKYYQGEQQMAKGSGIISNFVIPGKELAQHLNDGKIKVIDIAKESSEGKLPDEGESTKI